MGCVLLGLGGVWIGGTLGIVLGGFFASVKARDLDSAYQHLSAAIHEYLEACAKQGNAAPCSPDQLMVLRRVIAEADALAGLALEATEGAHSANAVPRDSSESLSEGRQAAG